MPLRVARGKLTGVRALLRRHWLWFSLFALLGLALRLFFVFKYPLVQGDSLIYGDIAKNLLQHGIYGLSEVDTIRPTLIRLPGYPLFLAACFKLFGMEHYNAVMFVQTVMDLATAFVVSACAWEVTDSGDDGALTANPSAVLGGVRAALLAFAFYCVFPYTANFVSQPLAETPTLLTLSLSLYFALRALRSGLLRHWIGCGTVCALTVVLRPDGGIILVAIAAFLIWRWVRTLKSFRRDVLPPLVVLALCTAVLLMPWTVRNWRVFHVVQPLAPANATDPGESYDRGFVDWTKTWLVEFDSVYEIAWNVPGDTIDANLLPSRAFDSPQEHEHTLDLIARYNENQQIDEELDQEFANLARERRRMHPVRYYVLLPVGRVVDMWLRPRTDTFPIEVRWWEYWRVPTETAFSVLYAGIGVVFLGLACVGWLRTRRLQPYIGLFTFYIVIRTVFLLSASTSEPRYTIEAWPMVLVLAALATGSTRR
jgi:4-amino-4-deoxy-L-arabinose transferase-like glycosyltransferase